LPESLRKRPKKVFPHKKFWVPFGIALTVGLLRVFFFGGSSEERFIPGPEYFAQGVMWQSYDLEWIELDGKIALDMGITGARWNGPQPGTQLDSGLLIGLCGSVLTKLPPKLEMTVNRQDIYRLGFRFITQDTEEFGETFPVAVINGGCKIAKGQFYFEWSYPGVLTGWRPSQFGFPNENSSSELVIEFQRRNVDAVVIEEFDASAACHALSTDPPYRMKQELSEASSLQIIARRGFSTSGFLGGKSLAWNFSIVGGTCISNTGERKA